MVLRSKNVGGGHWRSRETSISHVNFKFYIQCQCPSPSSLFRSGVGWHDGLVNGAFGASMPGGFTLGHILAGASDLVIGPLVIAGGAGMPQGDVVSAGETVVLIIVVFVGVGRLRAAVAVVGYIGGCRWNTARCWWSWSSDVVVASSTSATMVVASSAIVVVALVVGGWQGRRGWRHLDGEECDLLLGCRDGGTKFCHAGKCRLMMGIVRELKVG